MMLLTYILFGIMAGYLGYTIGQYYAYKKMFESIKLLKQNLGTN